MIDWDRYDDSVLPPCDGSSVDAVRVVFPHGRIKQALAIAERIRDKGYSIYLQAANTLAYSESDLSELADEVNKFRPVGISIVDTFGAMYEDDLLSIAESLDSMLDNGIKLDSTHIIISRWHLPTALPLLIFFGEENAM